MNALVLQCGGPTAVINASLAALIETWQSQPMSRQLFGARLGIHGMIEGDWADLTGLTETQLQRLYTQPGCALGSSRRKLADELLEPLLERLYANAIHAIFFIGGNGTMTAAHKLAQYAQASSNSVDGTPLLVLGIPKTIDNDLAGLYAAPGYASAARFIAQTTQDVALDLWSMRRFDDVAVIEVMGRHAGWLAAASAFARTHPGDPPHLILLPEVPFEEELFLAKVAETHARNGVCLVIAAEGICDPDGFYLAEKERPAERDAAGQKMLSMAAGVAPYLAKLVRSRLGLLCRQMRPDLIQRSSSAFAGVTDRHLATLAGRAAVHAAIEGHTGSMVAIHREDNSWHTTLVPFSQIIGRERRLPAHYFDPAHFDVTSAFLDYARPLLDTIHTHPVLF